MEEEPGLRVIREIKAFRTRDDTMFGLPFMPAAIVLAVWALLFAYYKLWLASAIWFAVCSITGKLLAKHDPYWLEIFPKFCRLPRILGPD